MDKNECEIRREISYIDWKLMILENAIADFGHKEDINEYFDLISRKEYLVNQLKS